MYSGANKTARTSQKAFSEAMVRLLEKKPYADISISELCQEAGISRQTFYILFQNKDNVLRYGISRNYAYPGNIDPPAGEPLSEYFSKVFSLYADSNYHFLRLLVRNQLIFLLYDSVMGWFQAEEVLLEHIPPELRRYCKVHIASTVTSVIAAYIEEGRRQTPEELEAVMKDLFQGKYLS